MKKADTLFQLSRDELCSKVSSLESERDSLANQKSSLEFTFELFKEQVEAMQDEQATDLANRVAELDAQLLGVAVDLEEDRRDLSSKKDASMVDLMDSLRLEGQLAEILGAKELQPSLEQLMLPIHREEDDVVLGETSLSFSLQVVHSQVQRIKGEIKEKRLSLTDV
ncbi:hypothetical protein Tco_1131519, partial [Tanacetum coccineum]